MVKNRRIFEKRQEPINTFGSRLGVIFLSVFVAFVIGSFLFLIFKVDPIYAYVQLIVGAFGNLQGFGYTLVKATPMLIIGLGIIFAWRSGFFYMGFEGCMILGAIATVWFALNCSEKGIFGPISPYLFFPIVFIISFIIAGLWSGLVGFITVKWGGNALILGLMANYIALLFVQYVINGPIREIGEQPQTPKIPNATQLPFIISDTRVHAGILIAILLVVITYLVIQKTSFGYKLIILGQNRKTAKYSGINIDRTSIVIAFIAGGFAGIAGTIQVLGVYYRVIEGFTQNLGFNSIVPTMLGGLDPIGTAIASFFYSGMQVGADTMQRMSGVPTSVVQTIQAIIVINLLIFELIKRYRININFSDLFKRTKSIEKN